PVVVQLSPDGQRLAASTDRVLELRETAGRTPLLRVHRRGDSAQVAFSADGRWLAAPEMGGARVWDARRGPPRAATGEAGEQVTSVAFSPDGQQLWVTTARGRLSLWQLDPPRRLPTPSQESAAATTVEVRPDGKVVLTVDPSGAVRLWDEPGGALR